MYIYMYMYMYIYMYVYVYVYSIAWNKIENTMLKVSLFDIYDYVVCGFCDSVSPISFEMC